MNVVIRMQLHLATAVVVEGGELLISFGWLINSSRSRMVPTLVGHCLGASDWKHEFAGYVWVMQGCSVMYKVEPIRVQLEIHVTEAKLCQQPAHSSKLG